MCYTDPGAEHEDNARFIQEIEAWLDIKIIKLKSQKYSDIYDVFKKTKFLVGPYGARCTTEMKKEVRKQFSKNNDVHIFGFTSEEEHRSKRFGIQNPEVKYWSPLIEAGVSKKNCLNILRGNSIEIPMMYRLGYKNNNCIGCVKGGIGYWNKIRKDFPAIFEKMSTVEAEIGISINRMVIDGVKQKVYLKDLPIGVGRYEVELDISCGAVCEIDFSKYEDNSPISVNH